jgi:CheY-like chemotaxis protein
MRTIHPPAPPSQPAEAKKPTVLVVDQSRTMRMLLAAVLSESCSILEASSCEEALGTLSDTEVDAIVCQSTMPAGTGEEFWRYVRAKRRLEHIPVLMLTSDVNPKMEQEARDAGVKAVLPKNVESERLLTALHAAIRAE